MPNRFRTQTSFAWILVFLCGQPVLGFSAPKPKYGPEATPLSLAPEYFQGHPAPHFWQLIPYYTGQRDGAACSVASVTLILNAARAHQKLSADTPLITQDDVLKNAKSRAWKNWLTQGGRGVGLDFMAEAIQEAAERLEIPTASIRTVHIDNTLEESRKKLHAALVESETPQGAFLVVNFLQGTLTGDAPVGHYSPVGAYDAEKKKVLILDPDRSWYEPYWVSEEALLQAMATWDRTESKFRGFVQIQMRKQTP
ncbi:MAG: phytochelatin synthase family protein [Bdellovibrionia bacterium]